MNLRRLLTLLIAAFMLIVTSGATLAQETSVPCGDLAEEDCTLLENSATAMQDLEAASVLLTLDATLTDGSETQTISVVAEGAYSGENISFNAATAGNIVTAEQLIDSVTNLLANFNGELTVTVVAPEATAGFGLPAEIVLDLSLVDGVGYINFDELADLIGPDGGGMGLTGWGGLDLAQTVNILTEQPGITEALDQTLDQGTGVEDETLDAVADQAFVNSFLSYERLEDADGDAVFALDVDFESLAQNEEFQQLLLQQNAGMEITEEDLQQGVDEFVQIAQNIDLNITQSIDTETNYLSSFGISLALDTADLGEDAGEGSLIFDFELSYADYNDVTITAPENANIAPPELLLGLAGVSAPQGEQ